MESKVSDSRFGLSHGPKVPIRVRVRFGLSHGPKVPLPGLDLGLHIQVLLKCPCCSRVRRDLRGFDTFELGCTWRSVLSVEPYEHHAQILFMGGESEIEIEIGLRQ